MIATARTDAANNHRIKLTQAKIFIKSTIDTDLLISPGDDILTKEPHKILQHIYHYLDGEIRI